MQTILLVEDNANNASLLEDVFLYDGIPATLTCVTSGEEALHLAASLQPALILMDLRLPGIDGLETTEILKSNPLTKDIPVWAITAYAMPGDEEEGRASGCEEYFAKPLSMRMLADRLRKFLKELEKAESREYASVQILIVDDDANSHAVLRDVTPNRGGKPMNTILLIEDNVNNVMLLEDIFLLDDISARLVSVETGEEALNRAIQLQPVLILMDLRLPGIDGLETTQILKQDPLTKDIPVWAITAYAMNGDEERARAAGCCEYISKPVHVLELANRLRTFLGQLERRVAMA